MIGPWILLSFAAFFISRSIAAKLNTPILNPLLISLVIVIPVLLLSKTPYDAYFADNQILCICLNPAVVALAYPLYSQLEKIKQYGKIILLSCLIGSVFSMLSGSLIALGLGAELELIWSILPKSVTTPIAMALSGQFGGDAALAAIFVLLAGLCGASFAYPIYQRIGIKTSVARGLTMGNVAHALGTATCLEKNNEDAAFSSLSIGYLWVTTALLAPFVVELIEWLACLYLPLHLL